MKGKKPLRCARPVPIPKPILKCWLKTGKPNFFIDTWLKEKGKDRPRI
jgi:hypothetical protein